MLEPILFTLILLIGLPLVFISGIWKDGIHSKLEWLIKSLTAFMITLFLFIAGNWDWISYFFRFLWPVALLLGIMFSWKKWWHLPLVAAYSAGKKFSIGIELVLLLVFGFYNVSIFISMKPNEPAVELSFPLKDGIFYVGQGGSNTFVNYHYAYPSQKYALDVSALNKFGTRAKGLYPKTLQKYQIFGNALYSPCNGKVLQTRTNLPDLNPPKTNPNQAKGNYVALQCDHHPATIYLAHMKQNSITVKKNELVSTGQKLGEVGNSGNTTEPHLHIHAEQDGKGVPITFEGKFLTRNQIVRS